MDACDGFAHRFQSHAGLVAFHHFRVSRFNAHGDHQRPRFFQHRQHLVGGVAGADSAVEVHAERLFDQQIAQFGDALFLGGKKVVVEIDVVDAEVVAQMLHVIVDIGR